MRLPLTFFWSRHGRITTIGRLIKYASARRVPIGCSLAALAVLSGLLAATPGYRARFLGTLQTGSESINQDLMDSAQKGSDEEALAQTEVQIASPGSQVIPPQPDQNPVSSPGSQSSSAHPETPVSTPRKCDQQRRLVLTAIRDRQINAENERYTKIPAANGLIGLINGNLSGGPTQAQLSEHTSILADIETQHQQALKAAGC